MPQFQPFDLAAAYSQAEQIKALRSEQTNRAGYLDIARQNAEQNQREFTAAADKDAEEQEMRTLLPMIKAGNPQAIERAVGRIGARDPQAAQWFAQNPEKLVDVIEQGLGVKPEKVDSPFANIPVDKFTPQSLQKFSASGNYADLVPVERPPGGTVRLPDGTVITTGGSQPNYQPVDFGKPARGKLEEALINAQGNAMALQQQLAKWRPEFSTYAGQFNAAVANTKDKAGMRNDPQTQQFLSDYNSWQSDTSAALSQYLNQLSGAAISPAEEARLKASFPNAQDGPTQYYSKLKTTVARFALVQARSAYLLSNPNMTLDSVSLDKMQAIMVSEANALAKSYEQSGKPPEKARQMALQATRAKYGIGNGQ